MLSRKAICITRTLLRKDFHAYGLARLSRLNNLSVARYHQKPSAENVIEGKHDRGAISADDPLSLVRIPEELKSSLLPQDEISEDDVLEKIQNENDWQEVVKLTVNNLELPVIRTGLERLAMLHTSKFGNSRKVSGRHDEKKFDSNDFQIIFDYFRTLDMQNSEQVHPLLSCYTSLLILNNSLPVITQLEQLFEDNMKRMPISCLASLIKICMSHHHLSSNRLDLYFSAKHMVMERWSECTKPEEMIKIMHLIEKTSALYTNESIREKILQLLPLMSPKDVLSMVHLLSKCKIRDINLLHSMTNSLTREQLIQEFEVKDYTTLLFDCSNLSFYKPSLLSIVSECLKLKISYSTEKFFLLSALQSFARLHYKNQQTLDSIYIKFMGNTEEKSLQDIARLLISLATLNYVPSSNEINLLSLVKDSYDMHKTKPAVWLDVVWSLTVLNLADEFVIASVLDPDFCTFVEITNDDSYLSDQRKVKLMNVDCAAGYDLEDYKGPRLLSTNEKPEIPVANKSMLFDVIMASEIIVPSKHHLNTRRFVPQGGYFIDVEICVDTAGKPLPLTEDIKITDNQQKHRIALKVLGFRDVTFPDQQPIGQNVIAKRHLEKLGYKVIEIPYYKWSELKDQREKVKFIERKILDAI